ncbi:MAG: hypothetical protein R3C09_27320 [Pirellulaceae bacterium]
MKIALDLGKFNTMCRFDTKTRKHSFLNATTDRNLPVDEIFKKHKIDSGRRQVEACGPSGWINDLAQIWPGTQDSSPAQPIKEAWKWSNVKQTQDRQRRRTKLSKHGGDG